jgi:two-component system, LuxR family, sensor kinase FixL
LRARFDPRHSIVGYATFGIDMRPGDAFSPGSLWARLLARLRSLFSSTGKASGSLGREALLSAMEETSSDAIITINGRGIMQSFNPAAEKLFGYRNSEVVGKNVKMLMPDHFRAEHDRYLERYLETGEKRIIGIGRVVAGQKKDGSTFPLELSVGESRINGASVFVGFIRDLTEIQTEQRRVQELQRELFHVSRLGEMGQIASGLAHEVNQPLAAIMNYLQVGRQIAGDSPEGDVQAIAGIIEKAEAQTNRAAEIVKRLRTFIDRREVERRRENLATLIEEAMALGLVGQAGRGTRVRLELPNDLPNVNVDRVQIQQVIVNLLRNAGDAMEGSARKDLTISARRPDAAFACVAVSDTGPGIDPQIAEKLFSAFVTTKEEGMGVGLSICKAIVENHGGRIWFEANPSGGTTFQFTLPIDNEASGSS